MNLKIQSSQGSQKRPTKFCFDRISHSADALHFAKKDGTVIYSGNIDKKLLFTKAQASNILRKQLTIKGIWNSSFKSKINFSGRYFADIDLRMPDIKKARDLLNFNPMVDLEEGILKTAAFYEVAQC